MASNVLELREDSYPGLLMVTLADKRGVAYIDLNSIEGVESDLVEVDRDRRYSDVWPEVKYEKTYRVVLSGLQKSILAIDEDSMRRVIAAMSEKLGKRKKSQKRKQ